MKCANCKNDAFYIYKLNEDSQILYCKKHLPRFLEPLRRAGNLETTAAFKQKAKETRQILNYGSVLPETVEEPVVEAVVEPEVVVESEAVVDEAVVEEKPKPRKKSKPKVELAEDEVNS